ncbi:hypothetical protein Agub_g11684 [Astrephomene gubernaculifera]|uniref:Uncharacterized protein n=4 Tax=Astrephomene gubernaculifera TaxID=47775 RepID=A0AAD3HQQ3_9CHLO|nr:hypothetical protein Agub_g11684 [Astrephomene gubernaculifera]
MEPIYLTEAEFQKLTQAFSKRLWIHEQEVVVHEIGSSVLLNDNKYSTPIEESGDSWNLFHFSAKPCVLVGGSRVPCVSVDGDLQRSVWHLAARFSCISAEGLSINAPEDVAFVRFHSPDTSTRWQYELDWIVPLRQQPCSAEPSSSAADKFNAALESQPFPADQYALLSHGIEIADDKQFLMDVGAWARKQDLDRFIGSTVNMEEFQFVFDVNPRTIAAEMEDQPPRPAMTPAVERSLLQRAAGIRAALLEGGRYNLLLEELSNEALRPGAATTAPPPPAIGGGVAAGGSELDVDFDNRGQGFRGGGAVSGRRVGHASGRCAGGRGRKRLSRAQEHETVDSGSGQPIEEGAGAGPSTAAAPSSERVIGGSQKQPAVRQIPIHEPEIVAWGSHVAAAFEANATLFPNATQQERTSAYSNISSLPSLVIKMGSSDMPAVNRYHQSVTFERIRRLLSDLPTQLPYRTSWGPPDMGRLTAAVIGGMLPPGTLVLNHVDKMGTRPRVGIVLCGYKQWGKSGFAVPVLCMCDSCSQTSDITKRIFDLQSSFHRHAGQTCLDCMRFNTNALLHLPMDGAPSDSDAAYNNDIDSPSAAGYTGMVLVSIPRLLAAWAKVGGRSLRRFPKQLFEAKSPGQNWLLPSDPERLSRFQYADELISEWSKNKLQATPSGAIKNEFDTRLNRLPPVDNAAAEKDAEEAHRASCHTPAMFRYELYKRQEAKEARAGLEGAAVHQPGTGKSGSQRA